MILKLILLISIVLAAPVSQAREQCAALFGSFRFAYRPQVPKAEMDHFAQLVERVRAAPFTNSEGSSDAALSSWFVKRSNLLGYEMPLQDAYDLRVELIARAIYLAERNGIRVSISYGRKPMLIILPEGGSRLNRIARRLYERDNTIIMYSPEELAGSLGFFRAGNPHHFLAVDTTSVMTGVLQSTPLHEIVHWRFEMMKRRGRPSSVSVTIVRNDKPIPPDLAKRLAEYANRATVEELVTHIDDLSLIRAKFEADGAAPETVYENRLLLGKIDRTAALAEYVNFVMSDTLPELEAILKKDTKKLKKTETDSEVTYAPATKAYELRVSKVVHDVFRLQYVGPGFELFFFVRQKGQTNLTDVDIRYLLQRAIANNRHNIRLAQAVGPALDELNALVKQRKLSFAEIEDRVSRIDGAKTDIVNQSWQDD